jgi:hypothetical protein
VDGKFRKYTIVIRVQLHVQYHAKFSISSISFNPNIFTESPSPFWIVSRDGVSTETIGLKCRPKQSVSLYCILHLESCASKIFYATNRRPVDVKWRVLELSCLLSSTLKLSEECQEPCRHFKSVAFHLQIYGGKLTTTLQWTAECQLSGKICPRNATDRVAQLLNCLRNATNRAAILRPWHFTVHIWARNVALDWNPATAILNRESPCLKCRIFLPHNF